MHQAIERIGKKSDLVLGVDLDRAVEVGTGSGLELLILAVYVVGDLCNGSLGLSRNDEEIHRDHGNR